MLNVKRRCPRLVAAILLTAVIGLGGGTGLMATPLEKPQTVALDFLKGLNKTQEWLTGAMTGLGAPAGWSIASDSVVISEVESLRAVNRIRAFSRVVNSGTSGTWVLLHVHDEAGNLRDCVTPYAAQMIPSLSELDFGMTFAQSILRTDQPDLCIIDPAETDLFSNAPRQMLRAFFDGAGDLKLENVEMNNDLTFVRALIRTGYLVTVQSVSGRLRIL